MIETAQVEFELEQLLMLFREYDPHRILEIGVWHGGTLHHWLHRRRYVVAVDDAMDDPDGWHGWAAEAKSALHLIQGDSRDQDVIGQAQMHAPFQFLFVDAGHDYASVLSDWENYGPMVEAGGMVAFHDINPRDGYGVSDLWANLKPNYQTVEISAGIPNYCGIGVLWT